MSNQTQTAVTATVQKPQFVQNQTLRIGEDQKIPSSKEIEVVPINLVVDYWSPEAVGETKVLVYVGIVEEDRIPDFHGEAEYVLKDCAYFFEGTEDGGRKLVRCSASRLVSGCHTLEKGDMVSITYLGEVRNKTNNFNSRDWAIQPVRLKAISSTKKGKAAK